MKNNNGDRKKSGSKAYIAVGIGLIVISLLIVAAVELVPLFAARAEFSETVKTLSESETVKVTVDDPLAKSAGDLIPGGIEVTLSDEAEVTEYTSLFVAVAEKAKIGGRVEADAGSWDLGLRFHTADGKTYKFYLTDGALYTEYGKLRYYYKPRDAEGYRELYEKCEKLIENEA